MWFKIKDILYQNNGKGEYKTSKVGDKYDERRGKTVLIYKEEVLPDHPFVLNYIGEPGYIITTPVISFYDVDDTISYLETYNSIYVLEKVKD